MSAAVNGMRVSGGGRTGRAEVSKNVCFVFYFSIRRLTFLLELSLTRFGNECMWWCLRRQQVTSGGCKEWSSGGNNECGGRGLAEINADRAAAATNAAGASCSDNECGRRVAAAVINGGVSKGDERGTEWRRQQM